MGSPDGSATSGWAPVANTVSTLCQHSGTHQLRQSQAHSRANPHKLSEINGLHALTFPPTALARPLQKSTQAILPLPFSRGPHEH